MYDETDEIPDHMTSLPLVGSVFAEKYLVEDQVGAGGFARIFRARRTDVDRRVALKILMPQMPAPNLYSDELVSRFNREARAVAELKSPYSITMYDFGRTPEGILYMVFEFVEGRTISDIIRQDGAISSARTIHILRQVLLALHEIHEAGFLHRDLKPSNIMVSEILGDPDHAKLLDFGIAKSWTHTPEGQPLLGDLTGKGRVVGTPRYMSPEQVIGKPVSPATDIYSLGLVVWEMLAGRPYVAGDDPVRVMRTHITERPFETPVQGLSAVFRQVLSDMVERYPARRPQSVGDILLQIDRELDDPMQLKGMSGLQQLARRPVHDDFGDDEDLDITTESMEGKLNLGADDSAAQTAPMPAGGGVDMTAPAAVIPMEDTQAETAPLVLRPESTITSIFEEPTHLSFDFADVPDPSALIGIVIGGVVLLVVAWVFPIWLAMVGAVAFAAFVLSTRATHRLSVTPEEYDIETRILGFTRHQRGAVASLTLDSESTGADTMVLRATAPEGEVRLARLPATEAKWLIDHTNRWLRDHAGGDSRK